jgi:hypothetical protein
MNNIKLKKNFTQVCVWPGTVVGSDNVKDFESFIKAEFGVRAQYLEEIITSPSIKQGFPVENTGGRNDLFFAIHTDDIVKFAVPRLNLGIRWVEDVIDSMSKNSEISLYPLRVIDYRSWN